MNMFEKTVPGYYDLIFDSETDEKAQEVLC